ncbi:MAG: sigma-70 family RNA polymerase sigma factor [Solirubrobacteraceae bacterium]|nr:sigma-70 family RNA polymerase sigma factor [Solirubrobacteraceae bacterium]
MRATPLLRLCSDETLARRATGGDDDAFAQLYDRYRVRLEAYCRGILRHDEDARDAAQNALAAAFLALRRGTCPETFRPWLFRIAHNEAISVLRRRRVSDELPDTLPGSSSGPADALELREELTAVLAAVRELAPGARSALLLRELAGLDYPEVAQVLGTTAGGARQAVFEARVALQDDRRGRGTDCDVIRRELSVHDGRRRQARHIRGHLRGCGSCRDWSRAQRQRRQRLALGGMSIPFTGWLAGAVGSVASAGTGATLSTGLAVNSQTLATLAIVVVGTAPVVVDRGDPAPAQETTAQAAGPTPLQTSAGPARMTTTAGPPAHASPVVAARATTEKPATAVDGGGAERSRSGSVEQAGTRGPEGDRPAGARYASADHDEDDWWDRSRHRRDRGGWDDGERRDGGYDDGGDDVHETARPPRRDRRPAPVAPEVSPEAEPEPAPASAPPATTTTTPAPAPAEDPVATTPEAPAELAPSEPGAPAEPVVAPPPAENT